MCGPMNSVRRDRRNSLHSTLSYRKKAKKSRDYVNVESEILRAEQKGRTPGEGLMTGTSPVTYGVDNMAHEITGGLPRSLILKSAPYLIGL